MLGRLVFQLSSPLITRGLIRLRLSAPPPRTPHQIAIPLTQTRYSRGNRAAATQYLQHSVTRAGASTLDPSRLLHQPLTT